MPSGLYNNNITIVNDTSRAIRMMPQLGASLMIVILTALDVSFMLLELSITLQEKIYGTGVTHANYHLRLTYFYITGHRFSKKFFITMARGAREKPRSFLG